MPQDNRLAFEYTEPLTVRYQHALLTLLAFSSSKADDTLRLFLLLPFLAPVFFPSISMAGTPAQSTLYRIRRTRKFFGFTIAVVHQSVPNDNKGRGRVETCYPCMAVVLRPRGPDLHPYEHGTERFEILPTKKASHQSGERGGGGATVHASPERQLSG